jgi:hypothetical protein
MSQKISAPSQQLGRPGELAGQDVGQAAFFGLDDGTGVAGDQAARHGHSGGSRDKLTVSHSGVAFATVHLARNGR